MFTVKTGNILEANTDAIAIESSVYGAMPRGLGLVVKTLAGDEVEKESKRICRKNGKMEEGTCFSTNAGNLQEIGIKRIYHAVIAQSPGGLTSSYNIERSVRCVLEKAAKEGMRSIAIPGIGIESACDIENIAIIFVSMIKKMSSIIDIIVVDRNEDFIEILNGLAK